MSRRAQLTDHPILPDAASYRIIGLNYQAPGGDLGMSYIDLTLQGDMEIRVLRFMHPTGVGVEEGSLVFPAGGVRIADVAGQGGVAQPPSAVGFNVRVYDPNGQGVRFWADDVMEIGRSAV